MGAGNGINEFFYIYEIELTAATATATSTAPAEPIGSYPFIWESLGAWWNTTNGNWQIKISDNAAQKFFSSMEVKVASMVGVDQKPFDLPVPYRFEPGSGIMVEATNDGSGTDTLFLSFIGKRIPSPAL